MIADKVIVEDCYGFEDGLVDRNEEDEPILKKIKFVENRQEISEIKPEKGEMAQKDEIIQEKSADYKVPDHATKKLAELDNLRTYTGFFKYCSIFASMGFSLTVISSIDRIIVSFMVDQYDFSALSSVFNIVNVSNGLYIGFSAVICVDLSKIMMTKDIPKAKRYIKISM